MPRLQAGETLLAINAAVLGEAPANRSARSSRAKAIAELEKMANAGRKSAVVDLTKLSEAGRSKFLESFGIKAEGPDG